MGMPVWDFSGKTILVTGGSRGIGRNIVQLFAESGARVYFTYSKSKKEAEALERECNQRNCNVQAISCDLTSSEDILQLVNRWSVPGSPPLNYLVNNAGINADAPVFLMTTKQWDDVLRVNLNSLFEVTQLLLRSLAVSRGSIVNVASVAGVVGMIGQVNYSASKAGMIGFTKSLAKEVGSLGIRVNCVAPGYTETEMLSSINSARLKKVVSEIPLRRIANTQEIANTVAFLLSDASSYVTGEVLVVSGGLI